MKVLVIDGQGGKIGQMVIAEIKKAQLACEVIAVGTNGISTSAMMKAGADAGATGENSVIVNSRTSDVIIGPLGITIADSLLGEITPSMATAVGQSSAKKLLLPFNLCNNIIVGTKRLSMASLVSETVKELSELLDKRKNSENL